MNNQVIDHYRQAVEMVTAPDAFLELTTIEQDGHPAQSW